MRDDARLLSLIFDHYFSLQFRPSRLHNFSVALDFFGRIRIPMSMPRLRTYLAVIAIAGLSLLLGACAATTETHSSADGDLAARGPYKKLFVIAEGFHQDDRVWIEDFAVATLRKNGLEGVASHRHFTAGRKMSGEEMGQGIVSTGSEGVLYIRAEGGEVKREQVPRYRHAGGMIIYENPEWGYKSERTHFEWEPYILGDDGLVYADYLYVKLRTELQDVRSSKQLWQGSTDFKHFAKLADLRGAAGRMFGQIVAKMKQDKAI